MINQVLRTHRIFLVFFCEEEAGRMACFLSYEDKVDILKSSKCNGNVTVMMQK